MKNVLLTATCCFLAGTMQIKAADGFAIGTGTEQDPYQITSQTELDNVRNFRDKSFKLMDNIVLTGEWTPICANATDIVPFTGNFDGNGFSIDSLQTTTSVKSIAGLFGIVQTPAYIKNLTITTTATGITISANVANVGILAGRSGIDGTEDIATPNDLGGTIENVTVKGKISAYNYVGGLIGVNRSLIKNCRAEVDITAAGRWVGGLVGAHAATYDQDVLNSSAVGKVTSSTTESQVYIAGFVGYIQGSSASARAGRIANCYSDVIVTSTNNKGSVGGFTNTNASYPTDVDSCTSIGTVQGGQYSGGFFGLGGGTNASRKVQASYCSSMAYSDSNNSYAGGFTGINRLDLATNCYTTGIVTGGTGASHYAGGFTGGSDDASKVGSMTNTYASVEVLGGSAAVAYDGRTFGIYSNAYYDKGVTNLTASQSTVTGLTAANAKTSAAYTGFDFVDGGWAIWENKTTPYFKWQTTPPVITTTAAGFDIETQNALNTYDLTVKKTTGEVVGQITGASFALPGGTKAGDIFYVVAKESGKHPVGVFFKALADISTNVAQQTVASIKSWFDTSGVLQIQGVDLTGTVTVTDLSGKTLYSAAGATTVAAQAWPAGIYIVKAGAYITKVIKK